MKSAPNEIENYVDLLGSTLKHIAGITREASGDLLQYKAAKKDWSVRDILAHLRSCSDVWESSIEAMLAKENPVLPDVHPRQWIKQTNYNNLRIEELLQELMNQRTNLLSNLKELSFEEWSRSATIGGRKHTVFSQVRRMARHEEEHVRQMEDMLQASIHRLNK